MADVTRILDALQHGAPKAAAELLPLVYEELRKLAVVRLANEEPGQTLQPTALVHEVWVKISADALGLAPRTVDRHWAFARAWLKRTIRNALSEPA